MATPPTRGRGGRGPAPATAFDAPADDLPPGGPAPGGDDGFLAPPGGDSDTTPDSDGHDDYADEAAPASADNDLLQLHRDLETQIFGRPAGLFSLSAADEAPIDAELITGVGIGAAHRDFESVGAAGPGAPVLNVYVTEKIDMDVAKGLLVDNYGASALSSDRQPVNVICSGVIDAQAHRHRQRPAPCGISVGHFRISAGTLGVLARGRQGVRANRLLMLSNNHVLANSNAAAAGDNILQPGPADGGVNPADRIAILEQWVPISFAAAGVNFVDAATGWCWPDRVRREFIYRANNQWAYFRVGSAPVAPALNQVVGKSGRTTQLTSGRVIDVNASIRVNYDGQIANFRDQVTIRGNNGDFSRGGDSGSLIWTWDARRAPVGLLFAGGNGLTFANKIGRVLAALDINLYT